MAASFPDTIRLGAFTYDLIFVEDLRDGEDDDIFGRITFSQSLIEIKAGMSREQTIQALLHECLHGLLVQMGNPPHTTEGTVDALSYSLIGFLVDNPSIMEMIRAWQFTTITAPTVPSGCASRQALSLNPERRSGAP